ncbi:hypothetical protein B6I21_08420 [candidate division KSB1 bacterium 4572_119]|nr:MAG: hypothetical protein B6I21_08420 [candidate division KSB1 bacterium 4572_119]
MNTPITEAYNRGFKTLNIYFRGNKFRADFGKLRIAKLVQLANGCSYDEGKDWELTYDEIFKPGLVKKKHKGRGESVHYQEPD